MGAVTADKVIVELEARTRQHDRDIAESATEFDRRMDQMEKSADRATGNIENSFSNLAKGIAATLVVNKVREYADAWTQSANRLRAVGVESDAVAAKQTQLLNIANEARVSFTDVVDLYARLSIATSQLGTSQADIIKLTTTITKAMKLAGASTSETQSAVLQLGQALGSGVLQGDELRSLRENAPTLAQAIANEFGVTIGQLKKLGETGQLTSDRVIKAILGMSNAVNQNFTTSVATIGDEFTILENNTIAFIGRLNELTGAGQVFGGAMRVLSDNLSLVVAGLVILGGRAFSGVIAGAAGATKGFLATQAASVKAAAAYLANGLSANGAAVANLNAARAEQVAAAQNVKLAASELRTAQAAQVVNAAHLRYEVTTEALAASVARVTAAETGLAAAHTRLAAANAVASAALAGFSLSARITTVALTTLRTVGTGLMTLLGGPWGIALTALAVGFYYLSSQESLAERSARAHEAAMSGWNDEANIAKGNLDSINTKLKEMTANQRAAAKETAIANLSKQLEDMETTVQEVRNRLGKEGIFSGQDMTRQLIGSTLDSDIDKFFSRFKGITKKEIDDFKNEFQGALFAITEGDTEMAGRAIGGLQERLAALRQRASDELKPAIDALATSLGLGGEKAEAQSSAIDRLRAVITLADDPTNKWAQSVLRLGDELNSTTQEADGLNAALNRLKGNNAAELDQVNRQIIALRTGGLKAYREEVADQKETNDANSKALKDYGAAIGKTGVTQEQLNEALAKGDPIAQRAVQDAATLAAAQRTLAEQIDATTEAENKRKKKGRGGTKESALEKRQDKASTNLENEIELQQLQIDNFSKTEIEVKKLTDALKAKHEAAMLGLKEGDTNYKDFINNKQRISDQEIYLKQLQDGKALTESLWTSEQKRAAEIANLDALQKANVITADVYQKKLAEINDRYDEGAKAVTAIGSAILGSIQGAQDLGQALTNIALKLAELAISGIFGQGPLGGLFNKLFDVSANGILGSSTNKGAVPTATPAARGAVQTPPGSPFWVGEKGPEPFIPTVPGTILPTNRARRGLGGGGGDVYNMYVDNPVGDTAVRALVKAGMAEAVKEAGKQAPVRVNEFNRRKGSRPR